MIQGGESDPNSSGGIFFGETPIGSIGEGPGRWGQAVAVQPQPGEDAAVDQIEGERAPWKPRMPEEIQTTSRRESIGETAG